MRKQRSGVTLDALHSESLPLWSECEVRRDERAQELVSFGSRAHASQRKGVCSSSAIAEDPSGAPGKKRWRSSTPDGPLGRLRPGVRGWILRWARGVIGAWKRR